MATKRATSTHLSRDVHPGCPVSSQCTYCSSHSLLRNSQCRGGKQSSHGTLYHPSTLTGLVILPPMIPHAPSSFQILPEPRPLSHVICLSHHHVAPVNSQPSGFSTNVTSSEKPVLITSAEVVSLHPYYCTGIFYSFADLIAFITIHNYGLRCLFTSLMTTLFPNIGRDEVCLIYFSIPSAKQCTWHIIGM